MTDQTPTVFQAKAANDRLVALTAIQKVLKGMTDAARAEVLELFQASGTKSMLCESADAVDLGTVSRRKGSRTVRVTDRSAFLAWVREHHPLWVEEAVADAPWQRLKAELLVRDAPCDEVGDVIPGVDVVDGEPGLSVRVSRDAQARMADVVHGVLPELVAAPSSPEPPAAADQWEQHERDEWEAMLREQ